MGTNQQDLLERIRRRRTLQRIQERRAAATTEPEPTPPVAPPPAEEDEPGVLERAGRGARALGSLALRAVPGGEPLFPGDEEEEPAEPRGSLVDRALAALQEAPERADVAFSPAVAAEEAGLGVGDIAPDIARQTGRGLSEVGFRTGIGVSELVGADRTAANLRADRELSREVYGEAETPVGTAANVAAQLAGEGALFMAPGAGAARGAQAIQATGRSSRFLNFLASPQGAAQRAAQTFLTGAPIDAAIAAAGPEESLAGALGELTGDEELQDVARDPISRGTFEVLAGFGLGEALGETATAVGRARGAGAAAAEEGAEAGAGRAAAEREPSPPPRAPEGDRRGSIRRRVADLIDPERVREMERLFRDELTGLPNQQAFRRAKPRLEADPETELVLIDLRNFKAINDNLGLEAGDQTLQEVADALRQLGVEERNLFRAGGDEFVIEAPAGAGEEIGRQVQELVGERPIGETEFTFSARYGVGQTFDEADRSAAAAKKAETGARARDVVSRETPQEAPGAPREAPAGEGPPVAREAQEAVEEPAPRGELEAEVPTRVEPGTEARINRTSDDPDFDQLVEGDEVEVLSVDDIEGTAEIRIRYPLQEGGEFEQVFEVPQEVLDPLPPRQGPSLEQRVQRRRELAQEPQEARVPWTERTVEPAARGRAQETLFPGNDAKVETEYAVVEASDVRASHTPDFTQRTPSEFPPEIQGRAYHGPRGRQAREFTERIVSRFDPDRAFDPTFNAAEGPPIVTDAGINVAGNGRTIAQQRLYQTDPERAQALLKEELAARAEQFGLDPEAVRAMDQPMLVRRITDERVNQRDVQELRELNQASDVPTGKAKDVLSDAASRAEQLRAADGALSHFAQTIPDDATLRSYLGTKDGTTFLRRLVEDGVISQAEVARFIDANTGAPTAEGKNLVEQIMFAAAVGDPDVLARAPAGVLRKMDTALPAIIRADRVEGFEIGGLVREALDLLASARAQDMTLRDLVAQVDITRPAPDSRVVQMARFLESRSKNGEEGIKQTFRRYADEAEAFARQTESEDLFGFEPRGPEAAQEEFAALVPPEGAPDPDELLREQFGIHARHDGNDVVNPVDPEWSSRRKLARIQELTAENRPMLEELTERLDRELEGVESKVNVKEPDRILEKAERPSIRQKKPWFDVEHVRDTLRFKSVVDNLEQIPEALRIMRQAGISVVKVDTSKLLRPKEWGWRMVAFDLRMPNGQLVEWYLPLRELEAVKDTNHVLFERWRNRKLDQLTPDEYSRFRADVAESFERFDNAFQEALDRLGTTREAVEGRFPELEARMRQLAGDVEEEVAAAARSSAASFGSARTQESKRVGTSRPSRAAGPELQEPSRRTEGVSPRTTASPVSGSTRTGSSATGASEGVRRLRQVTSGRGPASTVHPLSRDLFGEPVEGAARQGELGLGGGGPQGMTRAVEEARATVSQLEGRVARGAATDAEVRRLEDARSLIRRAEGRGLDAGEVAARARERGAPQEPGDTGDLFGLTPPPLAPAAQGGERLPAAGRFYDKPEAIDAELVPAPEIIRELGDVIGEELPGLGLKVATGRLPRGGVFAKALGVFKSRANVIRQIDISDVPVFGHEAGHAMHKLFFGTTPEGRLRNEDLAALPGAIRGELEDLGEGISKGGPAEGWAEFWRRYLDNPDDLQTSAPNSLRFVEERLEQFPAVKNQWEVARNDWTAFRESSAQARVGSAISVGDRDPFDFSIEDRWTRARTAVLDDMEPVRRVVQKIRDAVGIDSITEEADTLARLVRGSVGVANHFLEHGVLDFKSLRNVGPSLKTVLEPVTENMDEFRRYMVSRRAQELHERDILTGLRDQDVNAVVEQLDAKHGDTFRQTFERMQEWNQGLLAYLRDSGVISAKSFDAIVELNQSYVPFYRVVEGEGAGAGLGANFGHLFSPVKRIKGSGRTIIDPLESMVKNAMTYTQIAQKQQVSRALAQLAEKPGVGKVLEDIGNPIQRTQFRLGEIEKQLEDILPGSEELLDDLRAQAKRDFEEATQGLDEDEIKALGIREEDPGEEILAVFRPGDFFGSPNTISVLQDGKRVWYEVDEELFAALNGLDRESLDAWARWMGKPARALRAGATLAPEFLIRNPLRDQVMAFVQSEYGFVPFVDMAKGAFELLRKGEAYQQWISAGGYRAALTSLDRNAMQNNLQALVDEGGVRNVLKHPFDALQALSALMEDATRMGEFVNARAVEGTTKEGLQRAAAASREISVDFARHGAKTAALRHISAFWNARLQGYDRLFRAAKKNPAQFATKAFAAITLPSLLEYAANRDDPDYWEQPQWKRDLFWMIKVRDSFVSIPKPFELGLVFGTLPVRVIDSALAGPGGDHELQDFLFDSLLKGESSGFIPQPQAFMPLLENTVNYSFFLRRPIVPRSEQEVRARFQAGPFTSEVAQMLGRWSPGEEGLSPRKIDNLLFAWTGGLGRLGTQATDPLLEGRIPFTEGDVPPVATRGIEDFPGIRGITDPIPGFSSESVERFYEEYSRARVADATLRFLERSENEQAYEAELANDEASRLRSELSMLRDVAGQLAEIRATVDMIRRSPDMSSSEKREQIDELGLQARAIARDAMGRAGPGG